MPHETPLIATIVVGIGLAFIFGAIAQRLRISPLVGYLLAGVVVGPQTPGFVADQSLVPQLAEIGVILLMFGVGLHFSIANLLSVRAIALPGAVVQITVASALGLALADLMGWSVPAGIVFGLALSTASTVVLLRAVQERRLMDTERGRIAVGWLIVEDLAMVLALVLLPALAGRPAADGAVPVPFIDLAGAGLAGTIALTLTKVAAFIAFMLIVGRRVIPAILHYVAHTGSRELFRLAVLSVALGVAYGAAKLFGVSFALGAFFAGMVLSESELSHQAAQESLPLRDAFAVLFFVSVGMLFEPSILLEDPLPVIATLTIILVGKSIAAFLIVLAFGHPIGTALTISASLAQVGEFSFILAGLGLELGLLPAAAQTLILAGAILSIMLNPFLFAMVDYATPEVERRVALYRARRQGATHEPAPAAPAEEPEVAPEAAPATALCDHVVLVGYGRVGGLVGEALAAAGTPFLVIEDADKAIARLREQGVEAVVGNAARPDVLAAANVTGARRLVVAIPDAFEAGQIVQQARAANPDIEIVARAHFDAEVEHLSGLGADVVIMGEREIARGMIEHLGVRPPSAAPQHGTAPAAASDDPSEGTVGSAA